MSSRTLLLCCTLVASLTACGGTKLVKHAASPPVRETPLVAANNDTIAVQLDHVIVRNGPGAWAKNADWDEYLIRVRNTSASPLQITQVTVMDSLGASATPLMERKPLVKASKQTAKRYKTSGLKVMAGRGGGMLVAAGVGAGVVGYGAALGSMTGSLMAGTATTGGGAAGAAAGGLILAAPVLIGVGIARMVNNSKVDNRIESRATPMPVSIPAGGDVLLDVFFPISPSPRHVTIRYSDDQGDHQLELDTRQTLAGLHLAAPGSAAR